MMRRCLRAREQGFTYIAMLVAVAIIGIGLAATGQVWSAAAQRDKERELIYIGHEFRNAIRTYSQATPGPVPQYPMKLEDLLSDNRYPNIKRHLRRIYRDPMTGKAEWGVVRTAGGGIVGVYSLSTGKPIRTAGFDWDDRTFASAANYAGWRFMFEPLGAGGVPVSLAPGAGSGENAPPGPTPATASSTATPAPNAEAAAAAASAAQPPSGSAVFTPLTSMGSSPFAGSTPMNGSTPEGVNAISGAANAPSVPNAASAPASGNSGTPPGIK